MFERRHGDHLRALRLTRELTIRGLATRIGLSHQTIVRIERGERPVHAVDLAPLQRALGETQIDNLLPPGQRTPRSPEGLVSWVSRQTLANHYNHLRGDRSIEAVAATLGVPKTRAWRILRNRSHLETRLLIRLAVAWVQPLSAFWPAQEDEWEIA